MDERLLRIRESERKSHTEIYMNEELYNTNSWLQKPIKTVQEISLLFDEYSELDVVNSVAWGAYGGTLALAIVLALIFWL